MSDLRLRSLRLTAFKSYAEAELPLSALTVLIGRNGSGKSNALDALEILSRLAQGEEVRDALEGNRRDGSPVRGGVEGCAPHGQDRFSVGFTVGDHDDRSQASYWAELDVTVQVKPDVRILDERLRAKIDGSLVTAVRTLDPDPQRADLVAAVHNGRVGPNPRSYFRSSHLVTSQLNLRLEGKTPAERSVMDVSRSCLVAMAGVFHLDPVPHLMRGYVPEQDATLRRTAENLSAAVHRLKREDPEAFTRLVSVVKELPEHEVRQLTVGRGGFGDVMLALKERRGRASTTVPARQMSDGMLRMLAIATALLGGGRGLALDTPTAIDVDQPPLCLVLEELENGLHPSQAAKVLGLVKSTSLERGFQVVMTTHSPVLLNALDGDDHPGVLVCSRDRTSGYTSVQQLHRLPGYLRTMAQGRLGDAVTRGILAQATSDGPGPTAAGPTERELDELLGIG